MASRWWKRCTALDRFYFPSLFFRLCAIEMLECPSSYQSVGTCAMIGQNSAPNCTKFPLNSKVCLNWYLPPSIWTQRCIKKILLTSLYLVCIVSCGTSLSRTVLWPKREAKMKRHLLHLRFKQRGKSSIQTTFKFRGSFYWIRPT